MSGTHWIVEGRIDPRWPINTRGNIGEVFPEVLTPLSYELGVKPAEAGWREAYSMMGIADRRDFDSTELPVIIGLYGGYGYLNLSYLRMLGVRAPGIFAGCHRRGVLRRGEPTAVRTEARRQAPRRDDSDPAHRAEGVVAEVDAGTGGRQRRCRRRRGRRGSPIWRRRATTSSFASSTTTRRCSSRSSATT